MRSVMQGTTWDGTEWTVRCGAPRCNQVIAVKTDETVKPRQHVYRFETLVLGTDTWTVAVCSGKCLGAIAKQI